MNCLCLHNPFSHINALRGHPPHQPLILSLSILTIQLTDLHSPSRCRLTDSPTKRGLISFVGPIPSLPGPPGAPWIGITLDEPVGKNDGSVPSGERYFQCGRNRGVFVRAERVEVGEFPELGLEDEGSDMEEM